VPQNPRGGEKILMPAPVSTIAQIGGHEGIL
jgi:hypothetical protein